MRKSIRIAILTVGCILAASLQLEAKGYVNVNDGWCVTVTFHYDEQGTFIGTSSVTAKCNLPNGSYPFDLVVRPNITDVKILDSKGTPVGMRSSWFSIGQEIAVGYKNLTTNPQSYANARVTAAMRTLESQWYGATKSFIVAVPKGYLAPGAEAKLLKETPNTN